MRENYHSHLTRCLNQGKVARWVLSLLLLATFFTASFSMPAVVPTPQATEVALLTTRHDLIVTPADGSGAKIAVKLCDAGPRFCSVGLVDIATRRLLFTTPQVQSGLFTFAVSDSMLFIATHNQIDAYSLKDGSLLWQNKLFLIANNDFPIMITTKNRLVVYTENLVLEGIDTATGKKVWSWRDVDTQWAIQKSGETLVLRIFPNRMESPDQRILLIDSLTGEPLQINPTCVIENKGYTIDTNSLIIAEDKGRAIYLFNAAGCVQKYDLVNHRLLWSTRDVAHFSNISYGYDTEILTAGLYIGINNSLTGLDLENGEYSFQVSEENTRFIPLERIGEVLLVQVQKPAYTGQNSLQGINTKTGKMLWQLDMAGQLPINPVMKTNINSENSGWVVSTTPQGFVLLTFSASPNQITASLLDPESGNALSQKVLPLDNITLSGYVSPAIAGTLGRSMYLDLEGHLYELNMNSMELAQIY